MSRAPTSKYFKEVHGAPCYNLQRVPWHLRTGGLDFLALSQCILWDPLGISLVCPFQFQCIRDTVNGSTVNGSPDHENETCKTVLLLLSIDGCQPVQCYLLLLSRQSMTGAYDYLNCQASSIDCPNTYIHLCQFVTVAILSQLMDLNSPTTYGCTFKILQQINSQVHCYHGKNHHPIYIYNNTYFGTYLIYIHS